MFDMKKVGERISSLRKKTGMTQMALANRLGISYQAVSNWERGISMPDISNLKELAEIFETSVDDILGDEKSADVLLTADGGDVPNASLSTAEFNSLAPLLPPDKNMLMLDAVVESFDEDAASEAKANIDYGEEADDFVRRAYEKGSISMFSIFVGDISDELRDELFERAFINGNISFFSVLVKKMPDEVRSEYAKRAFDEGKTSSFSILMKYIGEEEKKRFRDMAFEEGKIGMFSMLRKIIKKAERNDDDEAATAAMAYESDDIEMFGEVVDYLRKSTLSKLFCRAYTDGKIDFVSEMVDYVSQDDIKKGASFAYENENLEIFSEMVSSMSKETKKYFKMLSVSDKRTDFLSEILADE